LPALSRLRASIKLLPETNGTEAFQLVVPLAVCQPPPLTRTCTVATPLLGLPGSLAVPLTVIGEPLNVWPLVGLEILTVGGVVSGLIVIVMLQGFSEYRLFAPVQRMVKL